MSVWQPSRLLRPAFFAVAFILILALLGACAGGAESTPTATGVSGGTTPTVGAGQTPTGGVPTPTPTAVGVDIRGGAPTATPTPQGQKPEYGGIMKFINTATHPDPYHITNSSANNLGNMFTNSLVQMKYPYDPAEGIVFEGALATEWSLSADGTKWTLKLRRGVTWHDGKPFTADDVVATFNRLLDPGLLIAPRVAVTRGVFKGAQKVDDHTVILDTGTPDVTAFSWIGSHHVAILPAHLIIGDPASADAKLRWKFMGTKVGETGTLLMGTGPYIMKSFEPEGEVHINAVRNPNYFRKDKDGNQLPYLDGVLLKNIADPTRRLAQFVANGTTYTMGTGAGMHPRQAKELCGQTRDPRCYTIAWPHGSFHVVLNHINEPAFKDPRIVKAVRYSMDMQKIFERAYGGRLGFTWLDRQRFPEASLSEQEQYKVIPWSDPARRAEYVQKAKDLLKEAGYPAGLDLTLPFYGSCSVGSFLEHSTYMSEDMNTVGIRNYQECRQGIVANDEMKAGKFSVAMSVQNIFRTEVSHMLSLGILYESPSVGRAPWKYPRQDEMDGKYREAVRTLDEKARNEKWKDLERALADDTLTIFPSGYSHVEMSVHGCVRDFHPGGSWESGNWAWTERSWLEKECR